MAVFKYYCAQMWATPHVCCHLQVWNRDINASRNILCCLQRLAARLERPSSLRRQAALNIPGILAEEAALALEDEHIAIAHAH